MLIMQVQLERFEQFEYSSQCLVMIDILPNTNFTISFTGHERP